MSELCIGTTWLQVIAARLSKQFTQNNSIMGRELKRVPLDFDWPLSKPWKGFINPLYVAKDCTHCEGRGESPETKHLSDQWYGYAPFKPEDRGSKPFSSTEGPVYEFAKRQVARNPDFFCRGGLLSEEVAIRHEAERLCDLWNHQWCHHLNADDVKALIAKDRLWDFTRTPRTDEQREIVKEKVAKGENSWLPEGNGYIPTPEEVNAWSICGFGHDSINSWVVIEAECKRLGVDSTCKFCKGKGAIWPSKKARKAYEHWEKEEPPTGEGYQLWETVSEGSPVTPVFDTPEKLADWLVENDTSVTKDTTREQWLAFINGPGWAPSFVMNSEGVKSGVQALS